MRVHVPEVATAVLACIATLVAVVVAGVSARTWLERRHSTTGQRKDGGEGNGTCEGAAKQGPTMFQQLWVAAQQGRTRDAVQLAGPGTTRQELFKAMEVASANDFAETLDALLQTSGMLHPEWDPLRQPRRGFCNTLLHYAARRGSAAAVEVLLKAGADHGERRPRHRRCTTPMFLAAIEGHVAAVQTLLAANVDWTVCDPTRHAQAAAMYGHVGVVRVLLSAKVQANSLLRTAIHSGQEAVLGQLLLAGADANFAAGTSCQAPLRLAVGLNLNGVTGQLLLAKAVVDQVDENGQTPLAAAVRDDKRTIVELLLHAKADTGAVTLRGRTLVEHAAWRRDATLLALLLSVKADVCTGGREPPIYAAGRGRRLDPQNQAAVVELLISAKAHVDAAVRVDGGAVSGETPICAAARCGITGVVALLAAAKANLDKSGHSRKVGRHSRTPLVAAARSGHVAALRVLLEHRANVHEAAASGEWPVFSAARSAQLKAVRRLLEAKASANTRNPFGITPLLVAARQGCLPMVRALIAAKADVDSSGRGGRHAAHDTHVTRHTDVCNLLLRRPAS